MKNSCYFLLLLLTMMMTLSACQHQKQTIVEEDLLHHRFVIVKYNNHDISTNKTAFIEFAENMTINGQICSDFAGKFTLHSNQIRFTHLSLVDEICEDKQLNQLDASFKVLLQNKATITLTQQSETTLLQLTNNKNTFTFKLQDLM